MKIRYEIRHFIVDTMGNGSQIRIGASETREKEKQDCKKRSKKRRRTERE